MRSFLLALSLFALSAAAGAEELAARAGLRALRAPMELIVAEAAKGREADHAAIVKAYESAGQAWQQVTAEPLDLGRYGVPAEQQEETWRQVRTLGLLIGYLDQALKRGDWGLMSRAASLMPEAYAKVSAALGAR